MFELKCSMCECELSYWPADGNTSTRLETFLPSRRTLVLDRLTCQTEYCVMLACRDGDQRSHSSNLVSVTTGQDPDDQGKTLFYKIFLKSSSADLVK